MLAYTNSLWSKNVHILKVVVVVNFSVNHVPTFAMMFMNVVGY